jgi:hypothetical protein
VPQIAYRFLDFDRFVADFLDAFVVVFFLEDFPAAVFLATGLFARLAAFVLFFFDEARFGARFFLPDEGARVDTSGM